MPRLGHKKSRNGCRQCKARHVKCDEQKPCSSCARHGVQCSLVEWPPDAPPPVPALPEAKQSDKTAPVSADRSRKASTNTPTSGSSQAESTAYSTQNTVYGSTDSSPSSSTDNYPFLTKFVQRQDDAEPTYYWVRDLALMHNWTTEAYATITLREDTRDFWRMTAPREAATNLYLMHELLAFSALHMAYFDAEQRRGLFALGIYHQDLTIRSMRKVLPNLSPDNAGPLFATTALMTLSVFGSAGLDAKYLLTRPRSPIIDLLDVFAMQQGLASILSEHYTHLAQSNYNPILRPGEVQVAPQPIHPLILQQIPALISYFERRPLPDGTRAEILTAIESFRAVLIWASQPFQDNKELRVIFSWPVRFSANFLAMLRQQEHGALVLIAYYCVALQAADPLYWFCEGWAQRVIRATLQILDESWHDILQWPWNMVMGAQPLPDALQRAQDQMQNTAISEVVGTPLEYPSQYPSEERGHGDSVRVPGDDQAHHHV